MDHRRLTRRQRQNGIGGKHLGRIPTVEEVAVISHQMQPVIRGQVVLKPHRRGKAAKHAGDRRRGPGLAVEAVCRHLRVKQQHMLVPRPILTVEAKPGRRAVSPDKAEPHRDWQRVARCPCRCFRRGLRQCQGNAIANRLTCHAQRRRARLTVPPMEGGHVALIRVGKRGNKIITGHSLPVMPLEIEVHATAEPVAAKIACHHADHLGALLIDGRGVEIIYLLIGLRADGMRGRAAVFRELRGAQKADIAGALHALIMHVGREALVAIDRQAFLERQLKPVAAGDAVAGPIVEIFVRDNGFNTMEVFISRGRGIGKHELAVEDVQPLIFHRAHIEMADGNDLEKVEVIFQPVGVFVPFHRLLQRFHGMAGQGQIALLDIDMKVDLASGGSREGLGGQVQIPDNTGKQVTRLGMRVMPYSKMTPFSGRACLDQIAVGQELRKGRGGFDANGEHRHHIRPVREETDAAEAFWFALRAVHAAGQVQPFKRGVALRMAL